jgi:hypothetical protein
MGCNLANFNFNCRNYLYINHWSRLVKFVVCFFKRKYNNIWNDINTVKKHDWRIMVPRWLFIMTHFLTKKWTNKLEGIVYTNFKRTKIVNKLYDIKRQVQCVVLIFKVTIKMGDILTCIYAVCEVLTDIQSELYWLWIPQSHFHFTVRERWIVRISLICSFTPEGIGVLFSDRVQNEPHFGIICHSLIAIWLFS